jgi:hypothetical protein
MTPREFRIPRNVPNPPRLSSLVGLALSYRGEHEIRRIAVGLGPQPAVPSSRGDHRNPDSVPPDQPQNGRQQQTAMSCPAIEHVSSA